MMNSFRHWLRLVRQNGGVSKPYFPKALATSVVSLVTSHGRIQDRFYDKRIMAQEIKEPPIFIIGHWRSGTTHLHNLMSQDPQFGFISMFQAMAPASYISETSILLPIVNHIMPRKRPMDNMALSPYLPQEEEFAIANLSPYSMYVGFYFPKRIQELFTKYALFSGIQKHEFEAWKNTYRWIVKKATFYSQGKRLVLKNPVNTARISNVLECFPGARFIHIYRNPYIVFMSAKKNLEALFDSLAFQEYSDMEIEDNVLFFYKEMMRSFFSQAGTLRQNALVDLRFEDLEKQPLKEMERLYDQLDLSGWKKARPQMEAYLETQRSYQKNQFTMTETDIAKVEKHWMFTIKRWDYPRPQAADVMKITHGKKLVG